MTCLGGCIINLYGPCARPCPEIEQELREELERLRKEMLESLERLDDRQAEVKGVDAVLCIKERRRVARDNTVQYRGHSSYRGLRIVPLVDRHEHQYVVFSRLM